MALELPNGRMYQPVLSLNVLSITSPHLENTLMQIASMTPVPLKVDEFVTLNYVRARGQTIAYGFEVNDKLDVLPTYYRTQLVTQNCDAFPLIAKLINTGTILQYRYERPDGQFLDEFKVTQFECDEVMRIKENLSTK